LVPTVSFVPFLTVLVVGCEGFAGFVGFAGSFSASFTVTFTFFSLPVSIAFTVISAVPSFRPLTVPSSFTEAIVSSEEVYTNVLLVASSGVIEACNFIVFPKVTFNVPGTVISEVTVMLKAKSGFSVFWYHTVSSTPSLAFKASTTVRSLNWASV